MKNRLGRTGTLLGIWLLCLVLTAGAAPVTDSYNNRADFSNTAGYKNWYYLYADGALEEASHMIYDTQNGIWRGNDFYCKIGIDVVHPGADLETVWAWKAPADGSVSFSCQVRRRPSDPKGLGADGVFAYVALSDREDYLGSVTMRSNDLEAHRLEGEVRVKRGQFLYFVTNFQSNYYFDQTAWNIDLSHTHLGLPEDGGRGVHTAVLILSVLSGGALAGAAAFRIIRRKRKS